MEKQLSSDISEGIRNLVKQVCNIEEDNRKFNRVYKSVYTIIKKSGTMYFLNKKEVDKSVAGMAEKFSFHGFFTQAEALQKAYEMYVTNDLPKSELMNRLNIVKLLLCMSETPTVKFLQNPEEFEVKEDVEEEIDWKEYLNEGIEAWMPNYNEATSEEEDSDISIDSKDLTDTVESKSNATGLTPIQIESAEKNVVVDFRANREELLNTIQHSWFHQDIFQECPVSKHREANTQFLWENFLEKEAMGLVKLPKVSIISEYKVIREILWQLWTPHASAVFEFNLNNIQVKKNITISSVRMINLQNFIQDEIVPYIELMSFFTEFSKSLETGSYECMDIVPITYKSYDSSLRNIIRPVYKKLSELEDSIREQETTYTLLNLSEDLEKMLDQVSQLKKIHQEVILDHNAFSNQICAATLLSRLHNSLHNTESKLDHDLRLTLFLESLEHYLYLIDSWFTKNDFTEYSNEFPIVKKQDDMNCSGENTSFSDSDIWKLGFDLRDGLNEECCENGIIKIIRDTVLQIGRNLHLLRLLGNFSLGNETKETIHQQFVRRVLEEICRFFKLEMEEMIYLHDEESNTEENMLECKYPVIWEEKSEKPIEMDKLENLVDTSDGFLMLAFEDYLFQKPQEVEKVQASLFDRISKICESFFPVVDFFENILRDILKERFTISGLMVKNLLIEKYHLEKQFQFLRHLFMFQDDLIFPFYRRLFDRMNSKNINWGNDVWLTSSLQDIIMDMYPDFYEKCVVIVKENWRLCPDSLETCSMVTLQYNIQWPLNIIISSAQMAVYQDIFQFILKIKWGIITLTHLYFTDLEPKMKNYHKLKPKPHRNTIAKLKYLKFVLINLLSNIQHYIFAFVFNKCLQKFETDFEKAYDLSSIISSHSEFINNIRLMTMDIRNADNGAPPFDMILKCVNRLKQMWNNIEYATPDELSNCNKLYEDSYKAISPILFPQFIFDY